MARAWEVMPGVPAAGHVTGGGFWHPGRVDGCTKCDVTTPTLRDFRQQARICPDCGQQPHNPRTGFCWKSTARSPRGGFHCDHCCARPGAPPPADDPDGAPSAP